MTRYDNFQTKIEDGEGLKVLLIDKDKASLMYMSSVLEEHSYIVRTAKLAFIGLSMIFESCIEFDLIICEIDMPGMDGFEFLKQVTSKADIPILPSENIELLRKSLKEGACFFFHKPIPKHSLVKIWQHVVRYSCEKNPLMQGLMQREMEKYFENLHGKGQSSFLGKTGYTTFLDMKNPGIIGSSTIFNESQASNNENVNFTGGNFQFGKRRREEDGISSSASFILGGGNQNEEKQKVKAPRLNWTPELQQKFKDAYEALGETRATPARIKELMNEPKLTPQHISSYLQKFRAKMKTQKAEPTEDGMEKEMHGSDPRAKSSLGLGSYPTLSLNSSPAPYPINRQLNIPRPNLVPNVMPNYHNTSGNLLQNGGLYNFRANTSTNFTNIFGQRVQGNIFPGFQPLEPLSATGVPHNNVNLRQFLPERNPQVLMHDLNRGYFGERESVPRGTETPRLQERNGGLGLVLNNFRIPQELTPEELDNILIHFSGDDSGGDVSSPEGNVSASSVTQPLAPRMRTATGEGRDTDETSSDDEVEEDMEKFLNMERFSANSDADDGFIFP